MENGLGRQSYSAGGTGIAQGNRSPKEIIIFMVFCKNMNGQNTVPTTGFESLFICNIFSNFHHGYLVSKISHQRPAKNMELNSVWTK